MLIDLNLSSVKITPSRSVSKLVFSERKNTLLNIVEGINVGKDSITCRNVMDLPKVQNELPKVQIGVPKVCRKLKLIYAKGFFVFASVRACEQASVNVEELVLWEPNCCSILQSESSDLFPWAS